MKDNEIRIQWKRRLFSAVPEGTKAKLFTRVESESGNRLFENLNERLEIQSDGTVRQRESYCDGYYPVLKGKEEKNQCLHPVLRGEPKEQQGTVVKETISDISGMGSGNFSVGLIAVRLIIEESTEKQFRTKWYVFRVTTSWGTYEKAVSPENIESFSWVKEATEGRAYFKEKKDYALFSNYIHEVLERDISTAQKEEVYSLTGWKVINGKWCYVANLGIIGSRKSGIRASGELKFEIFSHFERREIIKEFLDMEKICRREDVSRMLMLFTEMSVMTTLFERAGFPIKSILAIIGTTNSLKTAIAMVFSKIFNATETTHPEVTFSSTPGGIETCVAKYGDSILLVDDFMPGGNRNKQDELNSKLELLCRLYGDRTEKKRMTTYMGGQKAEYPVRGCCMITGEHITGVESSRTRMVNVRLEKNDVNSENLKFYQDNPLILPTYLYGFIEFLTENQGTVLKIIKDKIPEYRRTFEFKIARFNETAAQFAVTLDIMGAYLESVLESYNMEELKAEWQGSIEKIFHENDRQLETQDAVGLMLSALNEFMLKNPQLVKAVNLIAKNDCEMVYVDQNFVYVRTDDLYLISKKYCERYSYDLFLNKDMIPRKLKERGIIEVSKNEKGHMEAARKLKQGNGNARRFLYIKKCAMEEIVEKFN